MAPSRLPSANAVLGAAFCASGAAGLIYQVVWLRLLLRAFGSTTAAASTVVGVFMLGLACGGWAAGRLAKGWGRPLRAYGWLELALIPAALAASVLATRLPALWLVLLPSEDPLAGSAAALRVALAMAVLLTPAALMGATLPLLADHLRRQNASGFPLAWLYGANTLGAVAGTLLAGFATLGWLGERATLCVAAALNAAAGLAALSLPEAPSQPRAPARAPAAGPWARRVIPLMALSGFCALGAEVLWTRLLVLLMGTSVYAFSAMLALYLAGVAAGSFVCGRWLARERDLGAAFCVLQAAAGLSILATFEAYFRLALARTGGEYLYSPLQSFGDFLRLFAVAGVVVVPPTLAYGALFPVAARLADERGGSAAVGRLYAFNTLGGMAGSLATGFLLVPLLGTRNALYALAALHLGLAAATLPAGSARRLLGGLLVCGAVALGSAAAAPNSITRVLSARLFSRVPGTIDFHREGVSGSVTVSRDALGNANLLINGIMVSGKGDVGGLMAHLPLALLESPRRLLVIGLGAGNTFRAGLDHQVETEVAELEPGVLEAFKTLWSDHAAYLGHPRGRVILNDGRNLLLASPRLYDVIVMDGSPPVFAAGTVNLYTREFMELARGRLAKPGILALWLPTSCFEEDARRIVRSVAETFASLALWVQPRTGGALLLASSAPLAFDGAAFERRVRARGLWRLPYLRAGQIGPGKIVPDRVLRLLASRRSPVTDDLPATEFPLPLFFSNAPRLEDSDDLIALLRAP